MHQQEQMKPSLRKARTNTKMSPASFCKHTLWLWLKNIGKEERLSPKHGRTVTFYCYYCKLQFHSLLFSLDLFHFVLQRSVLPATLCRLASSLALQTAGLFHSPKTLQGLEESKFGKGSSPKKALLEFLCTTEVLFLQEFMFQKKKSYDDPPKLYHLSQEKQKAKDKTYFPKTLVIGE